MSWIEQTLRDLARRRSALAAPPAGENGPQPTGPAGFGEALGSNAPARPGFGDVLGSNLASQARDGRMGRDVSVGPERSLGLVEGFQKYLKRSGRTRDPLMDAVQGYRQRENADGSISGRGVAGAARLIRTPEGEAFSVNTTDNERRGLTLQKFELPGGQRVHVYYGKNGERTVVRLPRKRS